MASSRAIRLGTSLLLSLVLMAGVGAPAFGASPTEPAEGPSASAAATTTPSPASAPTLPAPAASPTSKTAPLAGCVPAWIHRNLTQPNCSPQPGPSGKNDAAKVAPNATMGSCDATGSYFIRGTVTAPNGTTPVSDIYVEATSADCSEEDWTASNGTYSLQVPAGSYTLYFSDLTGTYLNGYYRTNGFTVDSSAADPVEVNSADANGINLALQIGYYIRGTVTAPNGTTPLSGIAVSLHSTQYDYWAEATTASNGTYSVDVPAGDYVVEFADYSNTYLGGYYRTGGMTHDYAAATPVPVTLSDVGGIDVSLETGYYITGTVTGSGGVLLSDISVSASSSDYWADTTTSDGTYSLHVPTGDYTVYFRDGNAIYFDGYYSTGGFTTDKTAATPVHVTTSSVTGINVQMVVAPPWTVTFAANATTVPAGTAVTLTAQTSRDVGPTPYFLVILAGDGSVVESCGGGTICNAAVISSAAASATYHAVVGDSDGTSPVVASGTLTVTWTTPLPATYHALTPTRVLDSRDGYWIGLAGAFDSHVARTFQVAGVGGVPANATAVTGNLTVTGQTAAGFLYVGPNAMDKPTSSTLNFPIGDDRANAVTVALGAGGSLSATYAAPTGGATAQVIFDVTGYFTPDMSGSTYHALTPTRVLDSRDGYAIGLSGAFSSHVARTFAVAGHGGVPGNATAVTGNLTVTSQTAAGFLYVGPVAMNNPTSSTLNFPVGDDRANAVTVALGAGGTLSATYAAPTVGQTAQVIFDVTGYFTPDASGAKYHTLTPARVLDSRDGYWIGLAGAFSSHVARTFAVSGNGGVPGNATAVTGNLTVTEQTALGFLYVGPTPMNNPTSSTLNFPVGDDRANAVTVALGAGGTLSATYAASTSGPTAQVIFDVTGYFTP